VTMECFIDEKYHRTVIGLKGKNVQYITSEYNVQIKFPDRSNQNGKLEFIIIYIALILFNPVVTF